ncbi:hypothetical protein BC833DRAFT_512850, partial [Globomyces pollinis-pini]
SPWPKNHPGAPFDQEFFLIMNVAVGGTSGIFPDGVAGKPWGDKSGRSLTEFWANRGQW